MKLKSLILASLGMPGLVFAQVSLSNTEDYTVGTIIKYQQCDTSDVSVGLTGPKQIWDYSKITPGEKTITEVIEAPGKTPDGSKYPKANLAEKFSDGRFVYIDKENIYSNMVGVSSTSFTASYDKAVVESKRPVSFGGTNSFPYIDKYSLNGVMYSGSGMATLAADGYGTLLLPDKKKYTDVLRVKITMKQKDVSAAGGPTTLITNVTYVWYDAKHKAPLLRMNVITAPNNNSKSLEYLLSEEDK